jgi:iron uptake system EfeUOB component EfeO/EfeM
MKTLHSGRRLGVLVFAALVAAGACSSGESSSKAKTPEEVRAPASEVTAGLKKIQGIVEQVTAATVSGEQARAEDLDAQIEPTWQKIEGTVKANDQDAYVTFEDSFALIKGAVKSKDGAQASKGAADVDATVKRYLATYPG